MANKIIGYVEEEKVELLRNIIDKKCALENLALISDKLGEEKIMKLEQEYKLTVSEMKKWWNDVYTKYDSFGTSEIYINLVNNSLMIK